MNWTGKSEQPRSYVTGSSQQLRAEVFPRELRRERRRLLRQLKQIPVRVGITEAECRVLRYHAIKVMAISILLETQIQKSTTVSDGVC
jgi:hypothetical protein